MDGPDSIKETDIIFECSHCGKSLAIDYRAAGLSIPCSDCGRVVLVPIPEGMEVADFDATDEEREALVIKLRESLVDAQARVRVLEGTIEELKDERKKVTWKDTENTIRSEQIRRELEIINKSLEQIAGAVKSIALAARRG